LKLVFAGTPEFSVAALDALHRAGHEIVGVYTQPDRPAGRGQKLTPSPVAARAVELGLRVLKPIKLRGDDAAIAELRALQPEVMIVVAYGLILPQAVLDIPRHGCLNIHASLLPRWRGAAPIQRAILAGDDSSGVTIMQMDAGLDTGPMLLTESVAIAPTTTAADLHDALRDVGARLIVEALRQLEAGSLSAQAQPSEGATYAHKLDKAEARLDWARPALELERAVRGFNPVPVAWTETPNAERLRVYAASVEASAVNADPGTITAVDAAGIAVATGDGSLRLQRVQWAGGKPLPAVQAAQGRSLVGVRLA
jgi:methionyl-tRNA formyltransferase